MQNPLPLCHQVTVRLSDADYQRLLAFGLRRGTRLPQQLCSSALKRVLVEATTGRES